MITMTPLGFIANKVKQGYRRIFARPKFKEVNRFLFRLGLSGLGVMNYSNHAVSGELEFLEMFRDDLPASRTPVVFDVGAYVGDYTALVREELDNFEGYVFEPNPRSFEKLDGRFGNEENVHLFNVGCSENNGEMTLFDYGESGCDSSSHASTYRGVLERLHGAKDVESHTAKRIRLDDFVEEQNIDRIDLLKIDTEGHELEVLKGLTKTIDAGKVSTIQLEFNEMNVESGVFMRDIFDFLSNYRIYRLLPKGMLRLEHYSPLECELFGFQNLVALHEDRF
jgi:FkbM family methyltransferase